jgi:hypothetical protein
LQKNRAAEQGIRVGLCTEGLGTAWNEWSGSYLKRSCILHIELEEKIRKNDDAFIEALVKVFGY